MEGTIRERDAGRRVFIDTNICIAIIKSDEQLIRLLANIPGKPAISTVTVFELMLRKTNVETAEIFIKSVDVFPFDEGSAKAASITFKQLEKKGKLIPYRDLFIAATVLKNDGELITLNRKDFENIDGLKIAEF